MSTGSGTLRVVGYNLRGLRDDVGAAAHVVRSLDPDVLLLQEIPRGPGSTRAVSGFARRCGLQWSGRTRRGAGTALMSGARVRSGPSRDRALPVGLLQNPRGYTLATLAGPRGPRLAAVSIHLPLDPDRGVRHARQVLADLGADPALAGMPWVLGGDVNEPPGGAAWQALSGQLAVLTPAGATFPSGDPRRRIDAIFASPALAGRPHARVDLGRAVLTAATDHLPVWVDLAG